VCNLYPADYDSIRDREVDIRFHDRTKYDQHVSEVTSDYIELVNELIKLAKKKKASSQEIDELLDNKVTSRQLKSRERNGQLRKTYRPLLEGRFRVNVKRIDRQDDGNTIFGKHADFSNTTLTELFEKGVQDAKKVL